MGEALARNTHMKLLVVTQTIDLDDPVLGFFHRWVEELAKRLEHIEVICLLLGRHALPANVRVHSLGKETNHQQGGMIYHTIRQLRYAARFGWFMWSERSRYDSVFVHMNPEYIVLAGWLWRLLDKSVGLWYTHGTVSLRLRIAVFFSNVVFTASEGSMRVVTAKKRVMGHGIDLAQFPLAPPPVGEPKLITIGRASRVKRLGLLQTAAATAGQKLTVIESIPHAEIPAILASTHLFLHASATGSLDKAPLEALATGVPVITTNRELAKAPGATFAEPTAEAFAEAIRGVVEKRVWVDTARREAAREWVERNHDLTHLIPAILTSYENLA